MNQARIVGSIAFTTSSARGHEGACALAAVSLAAMLAGVCGCVVEEEPRVVEVDLGALVLRVNDRLVSPEEADRAGVRHILVERDAPERGEALGFLDEESYLARLDARRPAAAEKHAGPSSAWCDPSSYFYLNDDLTGPHLPLAEGPAYSGGNTIDNLKHVGWNDRISSVATTTCTGYTTLFEHVDMGGRALTLESSVIAPNLGDFKFGFMHTADWNDRAGSLKVTR